MQYDKLTLKKGVDNQIDILINQKPLSSYIEHLKEEIAARDLVINTIGPKHIEENLAILLGTSPANNQWGTSRVVLFRCQCVCDYCGVISFNLVVNSETIEWNDLRLENETAESTLDKLCFRFRKNQYEDSLKRFLF